MIHSSSSINTPIVEVLHERPSLLRRTTSAVLLFTDQQPTRTPRTNTPRTRYTSLAFILQYVLWLLDFRSPRLDGRIIYSRFFTFIAQNHLLTLTSIIGTFSACLLLCCIILERLCWKIPNTLPHSRGTSKIYIMG